MDSLVSGLMQGAIWMTFVLVVWGIGTIVKKKISRPKEENNEKEDSDKTSEKIN